MIKDPDAIKKALFIAQRLAAKIDPAFLRVPMPEIEKAGGGEIGYNPSLALKKRVTNNRVLELQNAADLIKSGDKSREEYQELVNKHKPVRPYESVPEMATTSDLVRGLSEDKHGKIGKEKNIPEGHPVGLRLDIPAYSNEKVWAPTIHDGHAEDSKAIAHAPFAHILNPELSVNQDKALNVARGLTKSPFAKINGFWKKTSAKDVKAMAEKYLNHPDWTQVGMDPERHGFFYDRKSQNPVTHGDEALQIGPLVLVKNAQYKGAGDEKYAEGGDVEPDKAPPVYYSALEQGVSDAKQMQAPPQGWKAITSKLPGVKQEEIDYSGLHDFLDKQQGQVSKNSLMEYLKNNPAVDLDEIWKSGITGENKTRFGSWTLPGGKNYKELVLTIPPVVNRYNKRLNQIASKYGRASNSSGYGSYASPEEIEELSNLAERSEGETPYMPPEAHRYKDDKSNVNRLAHVRMNDRVGPNGEKLLHIEELQSDWHQKGRDEKYFDPKKQKQIDYHNEERRRITAALQTAVDQYKDAYNAAIKPHEDAFKAAKKPHDDKYLNIGYEAFQAAIKPHRDAFNAAIKPHQDAYNAAIKPHQDAYNAAIKPHEDAIKALGPNKGLPDAPYKDTKDWTALAMKRVMRHAVDNDYDGITWTTGDQQADRYDLSKQVSSIKADQYNIADENGWRLNVKGKNGDSIPMPGHYLSDDELADHVGKDMAKKIIDSNGGEFHGLDLKVGGSGMRKYYDEIVPSVANKLGKEHGVKHSIIQYPESGKKYRIEQTGTQMGRPAYTAYDEDNNIIERSTIREDVEDGIKREKGMSGERLHYLPVKPSMKKAAKLFKSGGTVQPYKHTGVIGDAEKAKRRALMIARGLRKAAGGDVEKLPAEAGTSPIPEGHVRLYHQTSEENIPSILKSGLTLSRARGIEGPKAIYADEQGFYGKPGDAPTVEFSVPKERWKPPFVMGDVNPSDIIAHHVPWHRQARYILNHPGILKEVMSGQHDDLTGDYKKAVDHIKRVHKASGGDVEKLSNKDSQTPDLVGDIAPVGGVQPVFYNKSVEMLRDPDSMNQMKLATPYKWNKEFQRYGVKKDELDRYGFDLGSKDKMPRDQLLKLASSVMPRVSEKILGFDGGTNFANSVVTDHGRWETLDPDSDSLSEDADSMLRQDLKSEIKDPSWWAHQEHMNDAVESYLENNVPAIDDVEPHRLKKFLDHSVNQGWLYPEEAEKFSDNVSNGFANKKDWEKLLSQVHKSVTDNFGDKRTLEHADQPSLFDAASRPQSPKTHDYLKPLERAVEDVSGGKAPVMDHLHDHLRDALQDTYYEMARDSYYENPDSPKRKAVTVSHGDNEKDYQIHSTYDGYEVFDNRLRRIGETENEDEAESLIRNHFAKQINPHHDENAPPQESGESRRAPAPSENPLHEAYMLPGLEDYREHLFKFKPDSGTFDRGHYEPDVLVHTRYGTVFDDKGKRLLYVDEIQADWHQKALEDGYATKDVMKQIEAAKQKYPKAHDQLNRDREHILNSLGVDAYMPRGADPLAGLMLLNPDSLTPSQSFAVSDVFHRLQREERPRLFGRNELRHGEELPVVAEALRHYHDYAKSALGDNYTDAAMQLNRSLEAHDSLQKAINGNFVPDAPWKNASEYGKLMMKRIMRIAADHHYDGVALSPGWVQNQRWGADHTKLYDKIYGNTLSKLAKERGMSTQYAKIPLLEEQAKKPGRGPDKIHKSPYAKTVYFTPEGNQSVKKSFSLFKRGGMAEVPHAVIGDAEKAKRRALMIARGLHKAAGGDVEEDEEPNPRAVIGNNNPPSNVVKPTPGVKKWALPGQPTRDFDYTDPKTKKTTKHVFAVTDPDKDVTTKSMAAETNAALAYHLSLPQGQRIANSKAASNKLAPYVGRDKNGSVKPFLTMNAKLEKAGQGYEAGETYEGASPLEIEDNLGVKTIGMPLSPAYQHNKYKVCPNSASCKESCLGTTSGNYSNEDWWPQQNSVNKTHAFLSEPGALVVALHNEITKEKLGAEIDGKKLAVRMNVLSDTDPRVWEPLIKAHPDVDFYDYTKMNYDPIAPNHHYTYSSTGVSQPKENTGLDEDIHNPNQNWKQMRQRLDTGSNVAMVFTHNVHLPHEVHDKETGKTYKVIDGTTHDYRPLDKQPEGADGVIVGLRNLDHNKGRDVAAKKSKGFMVHYDPKVEMEPNKRTGEPTKKEVRVETGNFNKNGKPVMTTVPTNRTVEIAPQTKDFVPHNLREGRAHGGSVGDEMPQEYAIQQFHNFDKYDEPKEGPSAHQRKYTYGGPVENDVSHALNLTRRYVRS